MGIMLSQLFKTDKHAHVSVSEGLKRRGDIALNTLLAEFGHIKGHNAFEPQIVDILILEDKKEALSLIKMLKEKEKRCNKINVKACADGRKQRRYISKNEVASPAIQLESLV